MEQQKKNSFLISLITKEEEYITKFLDKKISIQKETEIEFTKLKEKHDKLWLIEKERIEKESYEIERKESAIRETLLWDNFYELIQLAKELDKEKEKAVMTLVDFFLKGGKISD